jgi:predicted DNA-binding transcriptional regulator AlpA
VKFGLTMNAEQVGEIWGCSAWTIYQMVGAGRCPVEPLRLGRKLVWPTASVLASVGLHFDPATGLASVGDETPPGSPGDIATLHSLTTDPTRATTDAG